ncbi:Heterokaryon incompatibility 6, OR allele [Fusarium agapanthi]|uniref:Heterokaryon incompatibility 6, OR allele n=1 Tax=Fusarium agapanthi TaxID=1803897 RepID=A0A9P5BG92_9HYPO|nr:Heterokaryon incompatibility 6, OR allele [Fusarium agapanthi]
MSTATQTPPSEKTLQEKIEHLGELVRDPKSDLGSDELPHLPELIDDWYNTDVDVTKEEFHQRILRVFKDSKHEQVYNSVMDQLPSETRKVLEDFIDGQKTADEAGEAIKKVAPLELGVPGTSSHVQTFSMMAQQVTPPGKTKGKETKDLTFQNWGRTIKNTPTVTYYPETVAEIIEIVRDAVSKNKGIRVAGFRHSWAPVFGRSNKAGQSTNGDPKDTELNAINVITDPKFVGAPALKNGKKYVQVGTATTNEKFRRWCINTGNVTLPMNIIEVEITFGGSNATICHGAGINNPTLSDLVRRIDYIDVNGKERFVNMSDPTLLKAASGCFGLLGVVTYITFECDAMCTAVMRPVKLDVVVAIPPPPEMKDSDIPAALRQNRTQAQKDDAVREFERRANEDFYAEWFWFPYSQQVWVNTWKTDTDTKNVVNYPSNAKTLYQVASTAIMNMAQEIGKHIHALQVAPQTQTSLLSWLAVKNFDDVKGTNKSIRTLLPNALHFQRGVQNIRVRNLEVEMALDSKKGKPNERDYTNVRRAWWDVIKTCYANAKTSPMRMPMEMRIMGSSDVTLAPQRGNKLGTCAIGILTLEAVSDIWVPYAQQVLDKWTSYKTNDGKPVVVKPHWAKEWYMYKVGGKPWVEKLVKEDYKEEIAEFQTLMGAIGKKHGWTLEDIKRTFSNDVLDNTFLGGVAISKPQQAAKLKTVQVQVHEVPADTVSEAVFEEPDFGYRQQTPAKPTRSSKGLRSCPERNYKFIAMFSYNSIGGVLSSTQIRLLHLLPATNIDDAIEARLEVVTPDQNPVYEALSYCWGDTSHLQEIRCNDQRFQVTENLFSALQHLRNEDTERTLWIDAICINQKDLKERQSQVKLMKDIYTKSKRAVIWLGPDPASDGIHHLFELMQTSPNIELSPMNQFGKGLFDNYPGMAKRGALALLKRPWWSRVWTVQEMALAPSAIIMCGNLAAPLLDIKRTCGRVLASALRDTCHPGNKRKAREDRGLSHDTDGKVFIALVRLHRNYSMNKELGVLLHLLRWLRAKDPRDKVYGSLGIAASAYGIDPDYDISIVECYTRTAFKIISGSHSLEIFSSLRRPSCIKSNLRGLPSLKDRIIRENERTPELLEMDDTFPEKNAARSSMPFIVRHLNDGKVLVLQGIITDRLSSVGDKLSHSCERPEIPPDNVVKDSVRILRRNMSISETIGDVVDTLQGWKDLAFKTGRLHTMQGEIRMDVFLTTILSNRIRLAANRREVLDSFEQGLKALFELKSIPVIAKNQQHLSISVPKPYYPLLGYNRGSITDRSAIIKTGGKSFADIQRAFDQRMATTCSGYFCLVPWPARASDRIALLRGGRTPYVLRKAGEKWKILGDCYVHGIMSGEAWNDDKCVDIEII